MRVLWCCLSELSVELVSLFKLFTLQVLPGKKILTNVMILWTLRVLSRLLVMALPPGGGWLEVIHLSKRVSSCWRVLQWFWVRPWKKLFIFTKFKTHSKLWWSSDFSSCAFILSDFYLSTSLSASAVVAFNSLFFILMQCTFCSFCV